MKRNVVAFIVLSVFSLVENVFASVKHDLQYDHAMRTWTCEKAPAGISPCVVNAYQGDTITITITHALPGLFTYEIKQVNREPEGLSNELAKKIGIVPSQATPSERPSATSNVTPQELLNSLWRSFEEFRVSIFSDGFPFYVDRLSALRTSRTALIDGLNVANPSASEVLTALKTAHVPLGMSDDQFTTVWSQLSDLLLAAPDAVTAGPSKNFSYEDRDFDITVTIKPVSPLLANAAVESTSAVRLRNAWRVVTTTGFAVSGLVDDHYTVSTDTAGKRHAVKEESDRASIPEATLFVHLTPLGEGWKPDSTFARAVIPSRLSLGIGIASGASGRIYAGLSWGFGTAGALTAGAAGGKVKRLSRNVNVDDLGNVDPEAARRDVYSTSYMFGISWSLTGK